ncbi:hypothetical protein F383_12547 [Gossypium arboreum]|uniref:Uncharacterized protein n=1 Tax=Gossypium arboreum TaxID=29729 RepID=A0A0B0N9Q6_GOSAR|nr:hypothetical protein F383_12547 [Gossypium arboreum]
MGNQHSLNLLTLVEYTPMLI